MRNKQHRRRFETFDKFSFYVAGLSLVTLMSVLTSLQSDQVDITRELAKTSSDQKSSISSIAARLVMVVDNQNSLRSTVRYNHLQLSTSLGDVEKKLVYICAKSEACN